MAATQADQPSSRHAASASGVGKGGPFFLSRSSRFRVRRRWSPRSDPLATSGCFSRTSSVSAVTRWVKSAAAWRSRRPGADWPSGRPALSSGSIPQRPRAAVTRRPSSRSGVTSAAVSPSATARRRRSAMVTASSRGDGASTSATSRVAASRSCRRGPSVRHWWVTGARRRASETSRLRGVHGAPAPGHGCTSFEREAEPVEEPREAVLRMILCGRARRHQIAPDVGRLLDVVAGQDQRALRQPRHLGHQVEHGAAGASGAGDDHRRFGRLPAPLGNAGVDGGTDARAFRPRGISEERREHAQEFQAASPMRGVRPGIESLQHVGRDALHLHLVHQPHQRSGKIEGGGRRREIGLLFDQCRDELREFQLAAEAALRGNALGRADEVDRRDQDRRVRVESVAQAPSHPARIDEDACPRQRLGRLPVGLGDEAAGDRSPESPRRGAPRTLAGGRSDRTASRLRRGDPERQATHRPASARPRRCPRACRRRTMRLGRARRTAAHARPAGPTRGSARRPGRGSRRELPGR